MAPKRNPESESRKERNKAILMRKRTPKAEIVDQFSVIAGADEFNLERASCTQTTLDKHLYLQPFHLIPDP
jgi:hypothetical protein